MQWFINTDTLVVYDKYVPSKRYDNTLSFLKKHIDTPSSILDLGVKNPLSDLIRNEGYKVTNTGGEDLDENLSNILNSDAEVTTAFEILEHLLSPYTVLKSITSKKLIASVPLNLWFASAYRSKTDKWDRHFHEFEDWQFNWLLEKTGWRVVDSKKWTNPVKKIGIRPILRKFVPRYYIVYAERIRS